MRKPRVGIYVFDRNERKRFAFAPNALTVRKEFVTKERTGDFRHAREMVNFWKAENRSMEYEWDQEKAEKNLRKHNVDFADAVTALTDEAALTLEDPVSDEERFISVGTDALGRILVVVYMWRGERIRLISARKATRSERRQYEGNSQ